MDNFFKQKTFLDLDNFGRHSVALGKHAAYTEVMKLCQELMQNSSPEVIFAYAELVDIVSKKAHEVYKEFNIDN